MTSVIRRFLSRPPLPALAQPGIYQTLAPQDAPRPYRLHLRVEPDGSGLMIVNASTVLHLNATATAHALLLIRGASEQDAARVVAAHFRVSWRRALNDQRQLREQVLAIATTPELDPVMFLGVERTEPAAIRPSAPYRLDLALTYRADRTGSLDPLARRRVDRELGAEEWKRILSAAWKAGIPHVTFTGGEPTLREDLVDLVRHAEALGQVAGLLTGGLGLEGPELIRDLSQAGLDHLLLTLGGPRPADHPALRNALASDIFTAAHLTLTRENASRFREIVHSLQSAGLAAISLSVSDPAPELQEALGDARALAAHIGMELVWDLPVPFSASNPISFELEAPSVAPSRAALYVEPDGDVLPSPTSSRVLGNLLRDDLVTIWAAAAEPSAPQR